MIPWRLRSRTSAKGSTVTCEDFVPVQGTPEADTQRGIIILDKSTYETTLQKLAIKFRTRGTRWGSIQSLADTPLFIDSRASRVIQLADHVAYATFRRYQAKDAQYFDLIAHKFYQDDGTVHGLAHKERQNQNCMCIACLSRR